MKKEFESWIRTRSPAPLAYNAADDLYLNPHVQARYEAWKASRMALRVVLPKSHMASEYAPKTKVFNTTDMELALQEAGIEVSL
ncbi:hypothetical protein Cassandra_0327 [Pseudomonas phage Cassandra]|nr:hypothetical protein Cassandra_0327 [Pseudomonas phage Cassandra]